MSRRGVWITRAFDLRKKKVEICGCSPAMTCFMSMRSRCDQLTVTASCEFSPTSIRSKRVTGSSLTQRRCSSNGLVVHLVCHCQSLLENHYGGRYADLLLE